MQPALRTFYWAAYYGKLDAIKIMIELLRWSPMLPTYKNRDILSAAILGEQPDIVNYLCKKSYRGKTDSEDFKLREAFNHHHDVGKNNYLHFMYMVNVPEINEIIKLTNKMSDVMLNEMNLAG